MLRLLAWVAAGIVALIALGVVALVLFRTELMTFYLQPGTAFASSPAPAAPDYETPAAWAAKPGRADTADMAPPGMPRALSDAEAKVDVFFIHPTTYYSSDGWNAPIDDATSRDLVDGAVMPVQASAFNLAGRVYAPYYRQATLYSFLEPWDELAEPDGAKALDLAYGDVARAFETYIRLFNNGRPFILAGHSQGSLHLLRLLQDYLRAPEMRARLVAAYVVGMSVPLSLFAGPDGPLAHVPPCAEPDQTGCLVNWNTFGPGGNPHVWFEDQRVWEDGRLKPVAGRALNCTNPLSWRRDGVPADSAPDHGALPYPAREDGVAVTDLPAARPLDLTAVCRDGILFLDRPAPAGFNELVADNEDYHIYDYNLFHGTIRDNAARRTAAYLAGN